MAMKERVILSGKGGTGKTTLTAAFTFLAGRAVLADCDVDAADLSLVLSPTLKRREPFHSGWEAVIRQADCIGCGACLARCRFEAVRHSAPADSPGDDRMIFQIDAAQCQGCGVCEWNCPVRAIEMRERRVGEWMISETAWGPLIHARMIPGAENSGKLVTQVRQVARNLAEEQGISLILVDGPPGIGCPVMASMTGASDLLLVAEPTVAGLHDLQRVLALGRHFGIPSFVCVNKWDLNPERTEQIEVLAREAGTRLAGRVRYDRSVTETLLKRRPFTEASAGPASRDIRAVWEAMGS